MVEPAVETKVWSGHGSHASRPADSVISPGGHTLHLKEREGGRILFQSIIKIQIFEQERHAIARKNIICAGDYIGYLYVLTTQARIFQKKKEN